MSDRSGDEDDLTCHNRGCAADPCYLHRDDHDCVDYRNQTLPLSDPECCGEQMVRISSTASGARRLFHCPGCSHLVVVSGREPQRTLTDYEAGDERMMTDGGRVQDTEESDQCDYGGCDEPAAGGYHVHGGDHQFCEHHLDEVSP